MIEGISTMKELPHHTLVLTKRKNQLLKDFHDQWQVLLHEKVSSIQSTMVDSETFTVHRSFNVQLEGF